MKVVSLSLTLALILSSAVAVEAGPCGGPNIKLLPKQTFVKLYDDSNTGATQYLSSWRIDTESGWYRIGDYGSNNHGYTAPLEADAKGYLIQAPGDILKAPTDFTRTWYDNGTGGTNFGAFWKPVAPPGYVCLGHLFGNGMRSAGHTNYNKPSTDTMRCVKDSYVIGATTASTIIWDTHNAGGSENGQVWKVVPASGTTGASLDTVYTRGGYGKPDDSLVHTLDMRCIDGPGFPTAAPTKAPTPTPTKAPTTAPTTGAPSPSPTKAPTSVPTTGAPSPSPSKTPASKTASSHGDPHFKTFSGEKFDFHGGCDLVLLQNPGFAHRLGLKIHIRTKINTWWSSIESAAVRVGSGVLEVTGGEHGGIHWLNGEPNKGIQDGDSFDLEGFRVHFRQLTAVQKRYRIEFGMGDAMSIETYKGFVSVNLKAKQEANFMHSSGLMGSYPSGSMLARDGLTVLSDPVQFGLEWQVLASEPMLFHSLGDGVHSPEVCAMPDTTTTKQRRLGEVVIAQEDAERVCAHAVDNDNFEACVFDVLVTNDKGMAGAY